jgi:hypothetical protein
MSLIDLGEHYSTYLLSRPFRFRFIRYLVDVETLPSQCQICEKPLKGNFYAYFSKFEN